MRIPLYPFKCWLLWLLLIGMMCPLRLIAQPDKKGVTNIEYNQTKSETQNTWALIYGINYTGRKEPKQLHFAVNDAYLFKSFLVSPAGGNVPESHIIMRLDSQVTAAWPYYDFKKLKDSVKQGDKVYVYFSGHGISSGPNKSYLLLYDAPKVEDPGQFGNMGGVLNIGDLKDDISELAYKANVFLIVDACRNNEKKEASHGNMQSKLLLNGNPPHVILLSCGTNQSSIEDTVWGGGHGVFTYYLVKGLEGMADIEATGREHATGSVTFEKLEEYLKKHVKDDTYDYDGGQKPVVDYTRKYNGDQKLADVYPDILAKWQKAEGEKYMASITTKKNLERTITDVPEMYTKFEEALKVGHDTPNEKDNAQSFLDALIKQGKYPDLAAQAQQELIVSLINDGQRVINFYLEGRDSILEKPIFKLASDKMQDALNRMNKNHPFYKHYQNRQQFLYASYLLRKDRMDLVVDSVELILKNILAHDSTLAYVYHNLSIVSMWNGQLSLKEEYALKAVSLAPNWKYAWAQLGRVYIDYSKYYEAVRCYKKAIEIDSTYIFGWAQLGYVYKCHQDYVMAMNCHRKIIEINPNSLDAWSSMGDICGDRDNKQHDFAQAIEYYCKALSIDSTYFWNKNTWNHMGTIYKNQKNYSNAIECYKKALLIDSIDFSANNNLGYTYLSQQNCAGATQCFQTILKWNTEVNKAFYLQSALNGMGNGLLCQGLYAEAINEFNKVIAIDSTKSSGYYNLVCAYSLWSKPKNALRYFEQALQKGYNNWSDIRVDADLDNIRNLPEFTALIEKYKAINK